MNCNINLYGYNISCNFIEAKHEIEESTNLGKIEVYHHKAPELLSCFCNNRGIQHFYFNNKTMILNDGQMLEVTKNSIDYFTKGAVSQVDLEYIAFTSAIPYLLRLNGRVALHGTAMTYKDEAIIFLGESGSWKSTISYALTKKLKERIISDDLIVLTDDNKSVYRGVETVRLFEENYAKINGLYNQNDEIVKNSDDKLSIGAFGEGVLSSHYKIRCIYILHNNIIHDVEQYIWNIAIERKDYNVINLLKNIKCWQSVNKMNIAKEIEGLKDIENKNIIKNIHFNSVYNRIEINIDEVVEAIINDIKVNNDEKV